MYPSRLREDLRELTLRDGEHVRVVVEHDGARTGRALVKGKDVLGHDDYGGRKFLGSNRPGRL